MAVSKDGLQYRFVIPGTRHASRLSGNPNFGNCRSRTNLDHRAIRGLTCSHVSLRYRHNAASAASRLYQADIVLQTNSGNLPAATFDWLRACSVPALTSRAMMNPDSVSRRDPEAGNAPPRPGLATAYRPMPAASAAARCMLVDISLVTVLCSSTAAAVDVTYSLTS